MSEGTILTGQDLATARELLTDIVVRGAILRALKKSAQRVPGRFVDEGDYAEFTGLLHWALGPPRSPVTESQPLQPDAVEFLISAAHETVRNIVHTARDPAWFDNLQPTDQWYEQEREWAKRLRALLRSLGAEPAE